MSETQEKLLDFVANQPEVRAGIAPGIMAVDLSDFFKNPENFLLGSEHGVVMFQHHGDGMWEGHYLFTDTAPRKWALTLCRRGIRELFTKCGARSINGVTPRGNLAARAVNRALGLYPTGSAVDTMGRDCIKYTLERDKWVP